MFHASEYRRLVALDVDLNERWSTESADNVVQGSSSHGVLLDASGTVRDRLQRRGVEAFCLIEESLAFVIGCSKV
jgi:hypothetical protein